MSDNNKVQTLFVKSLEVDSQVLNALDYLNMLKKNGSATKDIIQTHPQWHDFTEAAMTMFNEDRGLFLDFLKNTEKKIHTKEKVTAEVPEIPPESFTKNLYNLISKKIDYDFYIDYKLNKEINGLTLSIKGKYLDGNFKKLLKNYIKTQCP